MKYLITATAYDKRGRVLARRTNSRRTHPLQAKYSQRAGMPHRVYLHAELACLLASGTRRVWRLEVERYTKDGLPACAKPCGACRLAIKEFGVKHVVHT